VNEVFGKVCRCGVASRHQKSSTRYSYIVLYAEQQKMRVPMKLVDTPRLYVVLSQAPL